MKREQEDKKKTSKSSHIQAVIAPVQLAFFPDWERGRERRGIAARVPKLKSSIWN